MDVSVTTFNLNNLFSRFDFRGEVTALPEQPPIEFTSTFELPEAVPAIEAADLDPLECAPVLREYRTYKAKLVKGKDPKGRLMSSSIAGSRGEHASRGRVRIPNLADVDKSHLAVERRPHRRSHQDRAL